MRSWCIIGHLGGPAVDAQRPARHRRDVRFYVTVRASALMQASSGGSPPLTPTLLFRRRPGQLVPPEDESFRPAAIFLSLLFSAMCVKEILNAFR